MANYLTKKVLDRRRLISPKSSIDLFEDSLLVWNFWTIPITTSEKASLTANRISNYGAPKSVGTCGVPRRWGASESSYSLISMPVINCGRNGTDRSVFMSCCFLPSDWLAACCFAQPKLLFCLLNEIWLPLFALYHWKLWRSLKYVCGIALSSVSLLNNTM